MAAEAETTRLRKEHRQKELNMLKKNTQNEGKEISLMNKQIESAAKEVAEKKVIQKKQFYFSILRCFVVCYFFKVGVASESFSVFRLKSFFFFLFEFFYSFQIFGSKFFSFFFEKKQLDSLNFDEAKEQELFKQRKEVEANVKELRRKMDTFSSTGLHFAYSMPKDVKFDKSKVKGLLGKNQTNNNSNLVQLLMICLI